MAVAVKIYQRETKELTLESRPERGKGPVGRLRREQAMLPGIVYGHKLEPQSFKIAAHTLERALASGGRNAIFSCVRRARIVQSEPLYAKSSTTRYAATSCTLISCASTLTKSTPPAFP